MTRPLISALLATLLLGACQGGTDLASRAEMLHDASSDSIFDSSTEEADSLPAVRDDLTPEQRSSCETLREAFVEAVADERLCVRDDNCSVAPQDCNSLVGCSLALSTSNAVAVEISDTWSQEQCSWSAPCSCATGLASACVDGKCIVVSATLNP